MSFIVFLLFSFCICSKLAELSVKEIKTLAREMPPAQLNQVGIFTEGETPLISVIALEKLEGRATCDLIILLLRRGADPFYLQDNGVFPLESLLESRKMRPFFGRVLIEILTFRDPDTVIGEESVEGLFERLVSFSLNQLHCYRIIVRARKQWVVKATLILCMKELSEEYPGLQDTLKMVMKWQVMLHHMELLKILE